MLNPLKKALITGITGQDGSHLAELLVKKNYKVFGLVRNTKQASLVNIEKLYKDKKITLLKGNLKDLKSIKKALLIAKPDEIYNLAAQTNNVRSFKFPKETYDINYYGVGYVVDCARKINPKVKIFQASSSKMFENSKLQLNENSSFNPTSPYGKAKLEAHNKYVLNYRKKYNLFICSGILFNHESPRHIPNSVIGKISESLVKIKMGSGDSLKLGNIDNKCDWGYSKDYVKAMWMMLQQKKPLDFVIATGEMHSVREFVEESCKLLKIDLIWKGKGINEKGIDKKTNKTIIEIDPKYFRLNETNYFCGNIQKAKRLLGWKPKCNFKKLVKIMIKSDLEKEKDQV